MTDKFIVDKFMPKIQKETLVCNIYSDWHLEYIIFNITCADSRKYALYCLFLWKHILYLYDSWLSDYTSMGSEMRTRVPVA